MRGRMRAHPGKDERLFTDALAALCSPVLPRKTDKKLAEQTWQARLSTEHTAHSKWDRPGRARAFLPRLDTCPQLRRDQAGA